MTLDKFMQDLDAEDVIATKEAIDAMKFYDVERYNESTAKEAKDSAGTVIKEWFKRHPDETELVDREKWNLRAFMQTRRLPGHAFDFIAIRDGNTALLNRLIACGALSVNWEVAVAQGLEGEIKRYAMPSGESQALQVRPIE